MTLRTCYGALQIVVLLLLLYLPDANAYCAEFADYRNVIYSAPRANANVFSIVIIND